MRLPLPEPLPVLRPESLLLNADEGEEDFLHKLPDEAGKVAQRLARKVARDRGTALNKNKQTAGEGREHKNFQATELR